MRSVLGCGDIKTEIVGVNEIYIDLQWSVLHKKLKQHLHRIADEHTNGMIKMLITGNTIELLSVSQSVH